MAAKGLHLEHDLFIQLMKLKNNLRYAMGEDLITHSWGLNTMTKYLMLISSSRCEGREYLEHCASEVKQFLGTFKDGEKIAFVPYALKDHEAYVSKVREAFTAFGYSVESVHEYKNPQELINDKNVKAIFIGGGNTFRLLNELHKNKIFIPIKEAVNNRGVKYMGTSAGSNMACPTVKTTNDMPIVFPPSFDALAFVEFQINPHFVPGSLVPNHMGETRETRIKEFHEENTIPVIGLTEANWLMVDNNNVVLKGNRDAFIFERGKDVRMWKPDTELNF